MARDQGGYLMANHYRSDLKETKIIKIKKISVQILDKKIHPPKIIIQNIEGYNQKFFKDGEFYKFCLEKHFFVIESFSPSSTK